MRLFLTLPLKPVPFRQQRLLQVRQTELRRASAAML